MTQQSPGGESGALEAFGGAAQIVPSSTEPERERLSWEDAWNPDSRARALALWNHGKDPAPTPTPTGGTHTGETNGPWLDAMLAGSLVDVSSAVKGTRNATLNGVAYRAGRYVAGGHLDRQTVEDQLVGAALVAGLPEAEARKSARSGLTGGALAPADPPAPNMPAPQVIEVTAEGVVSLDLDDRLANDELRKLRARHRARELFDAERQPAAEPFDLGTLADVLARPAPPAARIGRLIPWEASTLVVAERKAGKTTLILNMSRSLLTGEPFLGDLEVRPLAGSVALLNFEVSGAQVARWAQDVGVPPDRLVLANLRGRRNPLGNAEDSARLAAALKARQVEAVIVDPFGRAFTGKNQNDAGEVGPWLVDLDRFARSDVGALDLILCAHAGWNAERSRGSSALEDWPDSIINLTRDDSDTGGGRRYLRALGRDVDLEEDCLDFDPDTRRLTLSGAGDRRKAAAARHVGELIPHLLRIVDEQPGLSGYRLAEALRTAGIPHQRGEHSKALAQAVDVGWLRVEPGKRNAKHYYATDLPRHTPDLPQRGTSRPTPTTLIEVGVGREGRSGVDVPQACGICGQPLAAVHVAEGFQTCPACDLVTR